MDLVFYNLPISNYGAKVAIALRLKNLAFDERPPPGGYGSPEYKAIVPTGTIPAIVHGDLVLAESETINEYLEEAFPEPALLPSTPADRARTRFLARYHDTRLEPPLRALFAQMAPATRDLAIAAARMDEFESRLALLAEMTDPAPWLAGTQLTLADIAYPATLDLAAHMLPALGRPFALPDKLRPWQDRLGAHPAVAPVLEKSREATRNWLKSKGL